MSKFTTHLRHASTQAGPRPFLSPYNVGIDIIKINRIKDIITNTQHSAGHELLPLPNWPDTDGNGLNPMFRHWIRKVFNYCEWPRLESILKSYFEEPHNEERLTKLARYVAGKWAVKEAAIKAHSYRRLFYRDVIVMYRQDLSIINSRQAKDMPVVLINPPKTEIGMTETVAHQRGLWRPSGILDGRSRLSFRRAKTSMYERQIARTSISHDGEYVTAIVYALDDPSGGRNPDLIIDDGYGDAIHEPLLGDAIDVGPF